VDRELVLTGVDTLAGHMDICNVITRITALVFHALITIIIIVISDASAIPSLVALVERYPDRKFQMSILFLLEPLRKRSFIEIA